MPAEVNPYESPATLEPLVVTSGLSGADGIHCPNCNADVGVWRPVASRVTCPSCGVALIYEYPRSMNVVLVLAYCAAAPFGFAALAMLALIDSLGPAYSIFALLALPVFPMAVFAVELVLRLWLRKHGTLKRLA